LEKHAKGKLKRKNADWIIANDVSPESGVMGGDKNTVKRLSKSGVEDWPQMDKSDVAEKLVNEIIKHFAVETVEV